MTHPVTPIVTSPDAARTPLPEGWVLRLEEPGPGIPAQLTGLEIEARVPGCVHTDLLAAGWLDDPDVGFAAQDQDWVGRSTWRYATTFGWQDGGEDRVDLVFTGLDTVAEVWLNTRFVGRTQNMHRTHRFAVRALLRPGDNTVEVVFSSVYDLVDAVRAEVGELPSPAPGPQGYVRKMGANFGTDWVPPLTTAGIWRPVELHRWSGVRIVGVRPLTTLASDGSAWVEVHVDLDATGPAGREVRVELGGITAIGAVTGQHAVVPVALSAPRLWWPVGHGEPHRYQLSVEVVEDDQVIDGRQLMVGVRRVEVVEEADDLGRRWALRVNGRLIRVRGLDWICDDPFPAQVGADRYRRRLEQALGTHANLLRVWGGATYEAEAFYDLCDELGVLVWQDFMFSAATYPETPEFAAEVETEAREVVTRLASHPSVVVWSGGNECLWGWHDWGWQPVLQGRPWGALYYLDLLPRVLAELDPTVAYVPGSPWSGELTHPPNDPAYGVTHLWDVWNVLDYEHYRDYAPAFVPELGWCGPPAWATLRRAVPDGPLHPGNPLVAYHFRAEDGLTKLARGVATMSRVPVERLSPADWHFLAQVAQARAVTVAIDHLRGLERCAGVVLWQLQDCWPVISWSMVDRDERLKPAWYAARAAFGPRRCSIQPGGVGLEVVLVNDELEPWTATVELRRVGLDGTLHAFEVRAVCAEPGGVARMGLSDALARPADPRSEVLIADVAGHRTTWCWVPDRDLRYPGAHYGVTSREVDDSLAVTVRAVTFLRDLCLFPDRLEVAGRPLGAEAVVDDLLVTLLPGESHTFWVRGADARHGTAVTGPPVLRCVNDLDPSQVAGASAVGSR